MRRRFFAKRNSWLTSHFFYLYSLQKIEMEACTNNILTIFVTALQRHAFKNHTWALLFVIFAICLTWGIVSSSKIVSFFGILSKTLDLCMQRLGFRWCEMNGRWAAFEASWSSGETSVQISKLHSCLDWEALWEKSSKFSQGLQPARKRFADKWAHATQGLLKASSSWQQFRQRVWTCHQSSTVS